MTPTEVLSVERAFNLLPISPVPETPEQGLLGLLSPEEIPYLFMRICDLPLSLESPWIQRGIEQLRQELHSAQIPVLPHFYLGDEWFTPSGYNAIAIPFYLAHPALLSIEQKLRGAAEGGESFDYFMRLLRHETGHCVDHLLRLHSRADWKALFGSSRKAYAPDTFQGKPGHPDFVENLRDGYGQCHPEEDFAETFAAWLLDPSNWKIRYHPGTQAYAKIAWIDQMVHPLLQSLRLDEATTPSRGNPRAHSNALIYDAQRMRKTLWQHYLGHTA